jgi:hypothetical protein
MIADCLIASIYTMNVLWVCFELLSKQFISNAAYINKTIYMITMNPSGHEISSALIKKDASQRH